MKRIYIPPYPHMHAGPPTGGTGATLMTAELQMPSALLVLRSGTALDALIEPPVTVDLSPLLGPLTPPDPVAGGPTVSVASVPVLPDGAIPTDINFADPALRVANDLDGTVSVSMDAFGTGPVVKARRHIISKTANSTLALVDEGASLHFLSLAAATYTIPLNSAVAMPIGAEIEIVRLGAGAVNIAAAAGVMLNGYEAGDTSIILRYAGAVLRKIGINEWLIMGAIVPVGEVDVEEPPPEELPIYTWDDVFTDHTATPLRMDAYGDTYTEAGADWTGWGTTAALPINTAVDFFLRNVVAAEAPNGAILQLHSPTNEMHLAGRLQPPPRSQTKNLTIDFTGQTVLRGLAYASDDRWGQLFLWGEKVNDPALGGQASVGEDAAIGDTALVLTNDADTTALLGAATAGSIIEIRTNTTKAGYHPPESRTTAFVESVNITARTLHLTSPLEIAVPVSNNVGSFESSDPSTVTLLQGSMLSANSAAGTNTITMANVAGLSPGDWLLIRTEELPGPNRNQWFDGVEPNFDSSLPDFDITSGDFGSTLVPINEEIHEIASIAGNVVTLTGTLGKNKLVAWSASALKIDPIENLTIKGGTFKGNESGDASAWDHQYIWTRYMIASTIQDAAFDTDPGMALGMRRCGQAVRFDTGDGNVMENLTIGAPQTVDAGEGYGVSFRLGERNSVIRNSYIEGCRHSIEYWASSGGNVCHDNHCHDDSSSSIDTHGNWNVDVTIRDNLITRNGSAAISADGDGSPDAIRIGNNKFVFDENIKVLNNRVIGYDGNALSIVPGVQNVLVDGLIVDGCQRVLNMQPNSRHSNAVTRNVVIRNVVCDNWTDKLIFYWRQTGTPIFDGLTLENWSIAENNGPDVPNAMSGDGDISGVYLSGIKDLVLRNFRIKGAPTNGGKWAFELRNLEGVTFDGVSAFGAERGIMFHGDCQDISGQIDFRNLTDEASVYLWWREALAGNTGSITLGRNQAIGTGAGQLRTQDDASGDALTITTVAVV